MRIGENVYDVDVMMPEWYKTVKADARSGQQQQKLPFLHWMKKYDLKREDCNHPDGTYSFSGPCGYAFFGGDSDAAQRAIPESLQRTGMW